MPPSRHCITCTCTPSSSSRSASSYHTSQSSPEPSPTPKHDQTIPVAVPRSLDHRTIAAIMHAVYFSSGPYSDAVDAVRNDTGLWPYREARQSENLEERRRQWEGMVGDWQARLRGEAEGAGGGVNRTGEERDGAVEGSKDEMGSGVGDDSVLLGGPEQKQEGKKQEAQQRPWRGAQSRQTQAQVQPTWTHIQQKRSPAEPARSPAAAAPATAEEVHTGQLERPVPVAVPEQRRTALDVFEFEARKPGGGW